MKTKNIILIIILIFIIAGILVYYFYFEQNKNSPDFPSDLVKTEDLLEFKNYDDSLSQDMVDKYLAQFESAKDMILNNPQALNSSYWLTIARMKKYVKDFQGAEQIYLYLISIDINNYLPEGNLADLYANYLYDYEKAVKHFWLAMEKSKPNFQIVLSYYRNLSDIYADKLINKKQEFENKVEQDLEKYNENIDFLTMLAKYYKNIDNKEKAIYYLEKALKLDPSNQTIKDEIDIIK